MYRSTTRGIRISVEPRYLADQSRPDERHYMWAYTIEIANTGTETVQLQSRFWQITDANGQTQDVHGPGVVGQQPVLPPGEVFCYTSGCFLTTSSGMMVGSYQMTDSKGRMFSVAIPAFSLDSPLVNRTLN